MTASDKQPNDGPGPRASLSDTVHHCQGRPEITNALAEIYRQVDGQIAQLKPSCLGGGTCCKFDHAGHLLYLSGIELANLLKIAPPLPGQAEIKRCPYQVGPKCTNRQGRPLGCRTYFCDKLLEQPLRKIHEQFHRQVRSLHLKFGIDYYYCELTSSIHGLLDDLS